MSDWLLTASGNISFLLGQLNMVYQARPRLYMIGTRKAVANIRVHDSVWHYALDILLSFSDQLTLGELRGRAGTA